MSLVGCHLPTFFSMWVVFAQLGCIWGLWNRFLYFWFLQFWWKLGFGGKLARVNLELLGLEPWFLSLVRRSISFQQMNGFLWGWQVPWFGVGLGLRLGNFFMLIAYTICIEVSTGSQVESNTFCVFGPVYSSRQCRLCKGHIYIEVM